MTLNEHQDMLVRQIVEISEKGEKEGKAKLTYQSLDECQLKPLIIKKLVGAGVKKTEAREITKRIFLRAHAILHPVPVSKSDGVTMVMLGSGDLPFTKQHLANALSK